MENPNDRPDDNVIHITHSEAMSSHVDDLLRRQMSLQGETGVTPGRRRWYYQNWFVFMIAGALGAFAAWAILEPYFDDMPYVQGKIEAINLQETLPSFFVVGDEYLETNLSSRGWIQINDQKIWLWEGTRQILDDDSVEPLDPETLQRDMEIGVYAEYLELPTVDLAVADYIATSPSPSPPAKATMSFARQNARSNMSGLLLFPLVAGFVGLAIGAADGLVCRLLRRALLAGSIGLAIGLFGGFISEFLAGLVYSPLNSLAFKESESLSGGLSTFGFIVQVAARALAWCVAGMAMGLGQGLALRSKRLLLYGLLGGIIGGTLGGLLFDPIDLILLGADKPSAHWSRMIGFILIGGSVGALIGIVELMARDMWLRMLQGPLAGKEFLIFKDTMRIGSSPRSDIYLFNDSAVSDHHATLRAISETCELESRGAEDLVLVNNRQTMRTRLRHGDQITIGRTVFVFETRQG